MYSKPVSNVIVFGETGAGKSSILNMLEGGNEAEVSNKAKGVTLSNSRYDKTISGSTFRVFDTVGLNEGMEGTVTLRAAIEELYGLICQLDEGVSLLIYVMRAPRIKATARQNYEMFVEVFCQKKVPAVIVITGLEEEEDMDQWWDDNKEVFDRYKMSFSGFACITATKGKLKDGKHRHEVEYNESKGKLEKLIYNSHSRESWRMPTKSWFAETVVRVHNICAVVLGFEPLLLASELYRALRLYAGMSDREAMAEASRIERSHKKPKPQNAIPNVIVFGETGSGKSSLVNILDGGHKADVSSQAKGVTFSSTCYEKTIIGSRFRVFDTVGLNEGSVGTVDARDAIEGLYSLICQLEDGVSLLIYVMRAPRIKTTAQQNYEMLFDLFCDKKVPVVIVITGLEEEEKMDQWWDENRDEFELQKMLFDGFACITATKGKVKEGKHHYEDEYNESKKKVEALIYGWHKPVPWKMPTRSWFIFAAVRVCNTFATAFGFEPKVFAHELYIALQSYGGLSEKEARAKAYEIEKKSTRQRVGTLGFWKVDEVHDFEKP